MKENDYEKLHLSKDTDLYGNMFYYLSSKTVFIYTIHGFGKNTKSMHGYHPKDFGNDGLFVSNRDVLRDKATLPDVFCSLINSLGIDYNPEIGLDGENIIS